MSRILPLSEDAAAQIHSSKTITTLQGVVLALLENTLDADATKFEIIVDFRRGGCTLEDNGSGVRLDEFLPDGGLGKMYHTSKHGTGLPSAEVHGSAGTYLASLAALCLLSITSKHCDSLDHATLVMHAGKVVSRSVPGAISDELRTTSGTRVVVRDLFGNMPVRVKQRPLANDTGLDDKRSWHGLKKGIAALLLAWNRPCSVRLKDAHDGTSIVLSSGPSVSVGMLTETSLNSLDGRARKHDLRDRLPLLSQAGLAPMEARRRFDPVAASTLEVSIKGFICLDPAPTRQCQFISLGIHPLEGYSELYEAINHVFANSSFGAVDEPQIDEAENDRRKGDRRFKKDGYTQKQLHGRKGVDRWPSFVLIFNIEDFGTGAARNNVSYRYIKAMVDLLRATATQWLDAHHFRPRKLHRKRANDQTGPAVLSSSPRRSSTADGITRISRDGFMTPSIKRAATMESATTSKRSHIQSYPDPSKELPYTGGMAKSSTYFNSLSRIKSGRPESAEAYTVSRAPAKPNISDQIGGDKKSPFALPSFAKGTLNTKAPAVPASRVPSTSTPVAVLLGIGSEHDSPAISTESDDYGSFDDSAILEACDEADHLVLSDPADADCRTEVQGNDTIVEWLDPATKQVYHVNSRTGVVLHAKAVSKRETYADEATRPKAAINTSRTATGNALNLARRPKTAVGSRREQWLPGFLREWDNPVFVRQDDERIPVASFDGPSIDAAEAEGQRCTHHTMTQHFAETGTRLSSQLSKEALKRVKVIRQVDAKFILCLMSYPEDGDGQKTLVLVDQHAASERVMLEGLFAELCEKIDAGSAAGVYVSNSGCKSAVQTILLEKPQQFQVSEQESELFRKHAGHFAEWGILYDLRFIPSNAESDEVQARKPRSHVLTVTALPPGIAERCVLFPHLLIELLRSEVWEYAEHRSHAGTIGRQEDVDHIWLRRIGSCPKGIIDMLNSRACRSAIMFNDVLSVKDCEKLLHDLSRCAFPFMCAHGRVSMVPLVELGGGGADSDVGGFLCESNTPQDVELQGRAGGVLRKHSVNGNIDP